MMIAVTSEGELARHQVQEHHQQHSGTFVGSTPRFFSRKPTKRKTRLRSPSLPLPTIPSVQDLRLHAVATTATTTQSEVAMTGQARSKGSKLLRSLSLRSVVSEVNNEQVYGSRNSSYSASSSSLWPSRWSFTSITRRNTLSISRSVSARTSRATLGTLDDEKGLDERAGVVDDQDDKGESPQFLPLIRVVSPITLEGALKDDDDGKEPQSESQYAANDARQGIQHSADAKTVGPAWSRTLSLDDLQGPSSRPKHKFTLEPPATDDIDEESDVDLSPSPNPQPESSPSIDSPASFASSPQLQFHFPLRFNPPTSSSSYFPQRMSSNAAPARPVLTRRPAAVGPQPGVSRRYTFAMAMNDEEITDEVLVKELERIRAIRAMSTDSSSNRTSSACLDAVSTAEVPDTQDLDDVWDLDDEEPELDLELDLNTSNGQRSRFFNDAGPAMCDSPMSESCGEGWGPPSSTHSPALQPLPHPSNRPSSPTTSPPSPVPSRPSLPRPLSDIQPSTSSISSWRVTRHALLTCRELVRTERHYLSSLISLLSGHTTSPPPPLMLHYTAVLVNTTRMFLERLERNPTPNGVAKAFVALEPEMDAAYVGWCGVVGSWFIDGDQSKGIAAWEKGKAKAEGSQSRSTFKRLSKTRTTGGDESTSRKPVSSWKGGFESSPSQPAKPSPTSSSSDSSSSSSSTSSTSSSSSSSSATSPASSISGCASSPTTSTFTSTTTTPSVSKSTTPATASPPTSFPGCPGKGKAASAPSSRSHSFAGSVNLAQLSSMHGIPMALVERSSSMHSSRKPAVRDLAILPTQRVMRYVLLFRDLLASTASNSQYRIIVESAAQAADRIARKCDRAQNNAAFIVSPSPSHSNKDPLSASKSTKFQKTKATDGLKPSVSARLRKEGEKEKEKEPKGAGSIPF
ncbi:hypothetical protein CC2G_000625 [Coprinopsis cinerea AmutBmut pab1-1]|nr:hypothetical protein CC2G_000625 [Coprinopsis cinerea AmutBmut pab1-1]